MKFPLGQLKVLQCLAIFARRLTDLAVCEHSQQLQLVPSARGKKLANGVSGNGRNESALVSTN